MRLLDILRRMALREKQSIREISRRTGLSRNTIANYLNAATIEPTFTIPGRPSKLDPFADKLAAWLKTQTGKSRKQHRTLKQGHADRVALGFTGSYGRVAAFTRDWRANRRSRASERRYRSAEEAALMHPNLRLAPRLGFLPPPGRSFGAFGGLFQHFSQYVC